MEAGYPRAGAALLRGSPPECSGTGSVLEQAWRQAHEKLYRTAAFLGVTPEGEEYRHRSAYTPEAWEELGARFGEPVISAGGLGWGIRKWNRDGRSIWAGYCIRGALPGMLLCSEP